MERLLDPDQPELSRRVARATLITRTFIVVAIALIVAVFYLLLDQGEDTNKIVAGIEYQQDTNTAVLAGIDGLSRQIESCTTPEGECSMRGSRRTDEAVDAIALRQVAAVACADQAGTQTPGEIAACVKRTLRTIIEEEAR